MHKQFKQIYDWLPPSARHVVASLRGFQLRSWRYGSNTEKLVEDALERETWSTAQWETYQENRLAYILHRAATQVPYYRNQWSKRRQHGDRASWEYLENWPILDKEPLRQNATAFVADDRNINQLKQDHTSGTTGRPIRYYRSKNTLQNWYALSELRWHRWYGVNMYDRWAILGGQLVTPFQQHKPPYWVWNAPMRQLYMSSYHIGPDSTESYLNALERFRISYIYSYTSSVYNLANEILSRGLKAPSMRVIITNAEPVFDYQRERIEKAFRCSVHETYGQAETVTAASQCEMGQMHLWPEVGYLEVLEDNLPVALGTAGELIATSLLNDDMIFIRYHLGDRIALGEETKKCSCQRNLPIIDHIQGRSDDILITQDGRKIGRLDTVFKSDLAIREAQIIQESLDRLRVIVVPADGFSTDTCASIEEQLVARMGDITVDFETVEEIPRTKNGKFRAVISKLMPQ